MCRGPIRTVLSRGARTGAATLKAIAFLLDVFPTLPSGLIEKLLGEPLLEEMLYPTSHGTATGDLYLPHRAGKHPGVLVCLGVVPIDVDHPQVTRLGKALARSGFVTLLYWSPAMRDIRLDAADISDIAQAYERMLEHPDVDPDRSGFIGTCVGGTFALMAAAEPSIRDRVAFVGAFAPYANLRTFARDIASSSCGSGSDRRPWSVDQLTRKAYVRTMTEPLAPDEAEMLRSSMLDPSSVTDVSRLSRNGRLIHTLLTTLSPEAAETALDALPAKILATIDAMSPVTYLADLRAPTIVIGHDRDDQVVPVSESRLLRDNIGQRPGFRYIEFELFQHADPTKRKLSPPKLIFELGKFCRMMAALYTQTGTQMQKN